MHGTVSQSPGPAPLAFRQYETHSACLWKQNCVGPVQSNVARLSHGLPSEQVQAIVAPVSPHVASVVELDDDVLDVVVLDVLELVVLDVDELVVVEVEVVGAPGFVTDGTQNSRRWTSSGSAAPNWVFVNVCTEPNPEFLVR